MHQTMTNRESEYRLGHSTTIAYHHLRQEFLRHYRKGNHMEIRNRLRTLREAKGMSQGDVERKTGLLRSYISRVEGGYTAPSVATLEKFASALGIKTYQIFYEGKHPTTVETTPVLSGADANLIRLFHQLSSKRRALVLSLMRALGRGPEK